MRGDLSSSARKLPHPLPALLQLGLDQVRDIHPVGIQQRIEQDRHGQPELYRNKHDVNGLVLGNPEHNNGPRMMQRPCGLLSPCCALRRDRPSSREPLL